MKNKAERNKAYSVKINKDSLLFAEITSNRFAYAPLEGLNLNVKGILEEFPDLKNESISKIKKEGIKRFKEKLRKMYLDGGEMAVKKYVIEDLSKYGYVFLKEVVDGTS